MVNFDYKNPARIIFGVNSVDRLCDLLKEYSAKSVLLIFDTSDIIKKLGIYDKVKNAADKVSAKFFECNKVTPNPKVDLVRELITYGKENSVDFIVAAGGGSVIDTAKAVAMGIPYSGDIWDFYDGKATPNTAIPVGAITTIPASGSETSNCSIITNDLTKAGCETDLIIPKFAIMDPSYTVGLPAFQTAAGCADILSHLIERYFTTVENVDATDYMLEGAMKALILNTRRVMADPKNVDARSEIQLLASVAHNGSLELGRTPDWASHRVEHEISGQYNITHGEGMAVVLVAYITYMADRLPKKMAQLANRLYGIDYKNHTEKEMALILAKKLCEFFKELGLRTHLREFDIDEAHFEEMADRATNGGKGTVGHYIPLGKKEFIEVLKLSL